MKDRRRKRGNMWVSVREAATLPFPACNTIFNGAPWKMSARKIVIKWGRNLYKFYLRALSECVCDVALAWLMLLIKKAFFHGNLFTLRNIRCRRQIVEIIFIVGNAASQNGRIAVGLLIKHNVGRAGQLFLWHTHLPLESFNDTLNALFYEQL